MRKIRVQKRRKGFLRWRHTKNDGIKARWIRNSLSLVLGILCAIVMVVAIMITNYYYNNINENLSKRATMTAAFFNSYLTKNYDQYYLNAEKYVNEFGLKDRLELQILDSNGRVLLSSSGFSAKTIPATGDVTMAFYDQKTASWFGKDASTKEHVMSVTSPLFYNSNVIGAVRYVTSLSLATKQIAMIVWGAVLLCAIFFLLILVSSQYFMKSIIEPVKKINTIAREIAQGRYGMRLEKVYDDEIGELCDTINYMSDEIRKAEDVKNDFISSVSHELRTPLTAIGGWSETLLACGAENTDQMIRGLEIIHKESDRLTQMVEELLDFTRIERGELKLNVETFDLARELYEAVYMYANLLRRDGLELKFRPCEDSLFMMGDRHRMKQVFLNVIDNAAKYGKSGGEIEVSSKKTEDTIEVRVRDYGPGIPENELPFVKQKFYKGSSKQRGSGIGLAVTDEIIKMHGGTLDIQSRVGAGTLVIIQLPALVKQDATEED